MSWFLGQNFNKQIIARDKATFYWKTETKITNNNIILITMRRMFSICHFECGWINFTKLVWFDFFMHKTYQDHINRILFKFLIW